MPKRQSAKNAASSGFSRGSTLLAVALLTIGCGQQSDPPLPTISGETMGTQYRVTLGQAVTAQRLAELDTTIEHTLAEFNKVFSTYDPDSVISQFNATPTGEVFDGGLELTLVVRDALAIAEDSGGAFDPTVGPLVNRWQFGPGREHLTLPADDEIDALRKHVGFENVTASFNRNETSLSKTADAVQLDLSAIAKGRGVDVLCERLQSEGITSCLVDIGGELRAVGMKPDGSPWKVAVRDPSAPLDASRQSQPAALIDAAMATSGSYFNFHEVDGVRYSHTIDPRTGRPVTHDLTSATVVACECQTADAYATTLMVLGPDAGYDWAVKRDVAAMLITAGGTARQTPAYESWLKTGALTCPD